MAKTNTVLIKLVSSADTGFYYVTKRTRGPRPPSSSSRSSTLSSASMSYLKKLR